MPTPSSPPMRTLRSLALASALSAARTFADPSGLPHREAMRRVKVLVSLAISQEEGTASGRPSGAQLLAEATALLGRLEELQSPDGTFRGGDNVLSPPDSAFTINDACDAHHILTRMNAHGWDDVRRRLKRIIERAGDVLLTGGVQTPNHRWEISAALARIHRDLPDPRLVARVDEWLAEGVDIDDAGHYSERSPNYAAAVSNPSLIAIATILNRPALMGVVERNLTATLPLIGADDTVETVQSRRQDQTMRFSLAPYLLPYRRLALRTGRGDLAWAAERARTVAEREGAGPELLAELLLAPELEQDLPAPTAPGSGHLEFLDTVGLAVRRSPTADVVVYGGSDYPRHRRIHSGLANNPTFLRMIAGAAVLDSVRLSRTFFSLGPFRADRIERLPDNRMLLSEKIEAAYYQPMTPESRHPDGVYALTDDGRFSASMAFWDRPRDVIGMRTAITAALRADGADLQICVDGPEVPFSLEFTFGEGGRLDPLTPSVNGSSYRSVYHRGGDAISVEVSGIEPVSDPIPYFPGEDYTYLNGTDASKGVKLLIGGTTPTTFTVELRAIRSGGPALTNPLEFPSPTPEEN